MVSEKYAFLGTFLIVIGMTAAISSPQPLNPFYPLNQPLNLSGQHIYDSTGDVSIQDSVYVNDNSVYGLEMVSATNATSSAALPAGSIAEVYLERAGDSMLGTLDMADNFIQNIKGVGIGKTASAPLDVSGGAQVSGHMNVDGAMAVGSAGGIASDYRLIVGEGAGNRVDCPEGYALTKLETAVGYGYGSPEMDDPFYLHCIKLGEDVIDVDSERTVGGTGTDADSDSVTCGSNEVVTALEFNSHNNQVDAMDNLYCSEIEGTTDDQGFQLHRTIFTGDWARPVQSCPTGTFVSGIALYGSSGAQDLVDSFRLSCTAVKPDLPTPIGTSIYSHAIQSISSYSSGSVSAEIENLGDTADSLTVSYTAYYRDETCTATSEFGSKTVELADQDGTQTVTFDSIPSSKSTGAISYDGEDGETVVEAGMTPVAPDPGDDTLDECTASISSIDINTQSNTDSDLTHSCTNSDVSSSTTCSGNSGEHVVGDTSSDDGGSDGDGGSDTGGDSCTNACDPTNYPSSCTDDVTSACYDSDGDGCTEIELCDSTNPDDLK